MRQSVVARGDEKFEMEMHASQTETLSDSDWLGAKAWFRRQEHHDTTIRLSVFVISVQIVS